jgi:hypothetical protein
MEKHRLPQSNGAAEAACAGSGGAGLKFSGPVFAEIHCRGSCETLLAVDGVVDFMG